MREIGEKQDRSQWAQTETQEVSGTDCPETLVSPPPGDFQKLSGPGQLALGDPV